MAIWNQFFKHGNLDHPPKNWIHSRSAYNISGAEQVVNPDFCEVKDWYDGMTQQNRPKQYFFLVIRPSNSGSNTGPPQDWMDEVASFCRFVLGDFGWWIVSSHPQFKISPLTSASRERSRSRFQTFGKSYTFCQRNPEVKKTCGSFHVDLEGHLGRGLKPQILKRSW